MPDDSEKVAVLKTIQSLGILVIGAACILVLALTHVIQDGETIAALSAVMSSSMGIHALNRKQNKQ